MCRVVKRNELGNKTSTEPKAKTIANSSSIGNFSANEYIDPNDISCEPCPIASPCQFTPLPEFDPPSLDNDPSSIWVSPDLILDSSKVFNLSKV